MSEPEIMVSVIVLTYNHELYIQQALESILSQKTKFRYEVLIGDDASTDRTTEIIQKYAIQYPNIIRAFFRDKNVGVTRNAYEILTQANGKYLASCEGDDYWNSPEKLQIQVDFLEKNSQYSGCTHNILIVDENGRPRRRQKLPWISEKTVYSFLDFKGIFLPGHTSSILRRNYLFCPDFDNSILWKASPMIGDRTIAVLWAMKGDFYRIDQILSCYRLVLSRKRENVTSQYYIQNTKCIWNDFEYTLCLESYVKEISKCRPNFDYHKYELLTSAIVACFLHPRTADQRLPKRIFHTLQDKKICFFMVLYFLLQKIKRKFVCIFDNN